MSTAQHDQPQSNSIKPTTAALRRQALGRPFATLRFSEAAPVLESREVQMRYARVLHTQIEIRTTQGRKT